MCEISDRLIKTVLASFDDGASTAEMAKYCSPSHSEATIERALHIGLERRRVQRVADFMTGESV